MLMTCLPGWLSKRPVGRQENTDVIGRIKWNLSLYGMAIVLTCVAIFASRMVCPASTLAQAVGHGQAGSGSRAAPVPGGVTGDRCKPTALEWNAWQHGWSDKA